MIGHDYESQRVQVSDSLLISHRPDKYSRWLQRLKDLPAEQSSGGNM